MHMTIRKRFDVTHNFNRRGRRICLLIIVYWKNLIDPNKVSGPVGASSIRVAG